MSSFRSIHGAHQRQKSDRAQPTPHVIRVRLKLLRNYHSPVLRAGEECLRAAMAEYAQSFTRPSDALRSI